uniref:Uncharacterized protein n=1 Tax=Ditylenchus dipsaci TaxID=166011 RepID=A0A915CTA4_9BILA
MAISSDVWYVFGTQYEHEHSKECELSEHIGRFRIQQLAEQKKLYDVSWTVVVTLNSSSQPTSSCCYLLLIGPRTLGHNPCPLRG